MKEGRPYGKAERNVYPGDYVPVLKESDIRKELKKAHDGKVTLPPVNITDIGSAFRIEIAVPGISREDLLVHADRNVISVCVLHKEPGESEERVFKLHEFNFECFNRHIVLPENIDVELASAAYKDGLLTIHVPKNGKPAKKRHTRIVVY